MWDISASRFQVLNAVSNSCILSPPLQFINQNSLFLRSLTHRGREEDTIFELDVSLCCPIASEELQ